jgi:hypothetical protein
MLITINTVIIICTVIFVKELEIQFNTINLLKKLGAIYVNPTGMQNKIKLNQFLRNALNVMIPPIQCGIIPLQKDGGVKCVKKCGRMMNIKVIWMIRDKKKYHIKKCVEDLMIFHNKDFNYFFIILNKNIDIIICYNSYINISIYIIWILLFIQMVQH